MSLAAPRARAWDILEAGILREMGLPMLVVSLVLFVSAMTLLGANVSEMRRGYARVQQANEALLELETVNNDILRIEMTVRGYALSGDPIYLTWKQMAESGLHDRVAVFDTTFGENQHANVANLKHLLAEHCYFFDRLAERVPNEREAVVAAVVAYGKKVGRKGIEDLLVAMRSVEVKKLAQEQVLAENRVINAYCYAIGMSAAALLFAGFGFALLAHDRRGRRSRA